MMSGKSRNMIMQCALVHIKVNVHSPHKIWKAFEKSHISQWKSSTGKMFKKSALFVKEHNRKTYISFLLNFSSQGNLFV